MPDSFMSGKTNINFKDITHTVEPVLKDHLSGHTNVVCQDRWSLVTGSTCSIALKCRTFCQEYVVFQDRWSLMAVVSGQVSLYTLAVITLLRQHYYIPYRYMTFCFQGDLSGKIHPEDSIWTVGKFSVVCQCLCFQDFVF